MGELEKKTCTRTAYSAPINKKDEEVVDLASRIGNTSHQREASTSFCIVCQNVPEISCVRDKQDLHRAQTEGE